MGNWDDWRFSLPLVPFYLPPARFRARYVLQIDFPSRKPSAEVCPANVNHTLLLSSALLLFKWTRKYCMMIHLLIHFHTAKPMMRERKNHHYLWLISVTNRKRPHSSGVHRQSGSGGSVDIQTTWKTKNLCKSSLCFCSFNPLCPYVQHICSLSWLWTARDAPSRTEIKFSPATDLTALI